MTNEDKVPPQEVKEEEEVIEELNTQEYFSATSAGATGDDDEAALMERVFKQMSFSEQGGDNELGDELGQDAMNQILSSLMMGMGGMGGMGGMPGMGGDDEEGGALNSGSMEELLSAMMMGGMGMGMDGPNPAMMQQMMMQQMFEPESMQPAIEELNQLLTEWFAKDENKKSDDNTEEYDRVSKIHEYVKELCTVYQTKPYPESFEEVFELYNKIQDGGALPDDIAKAFEASSGGMYGAGDAEEEDEEEDEEDATTGGRHGGGIIGGGEQPSNCGTQ